MVVANRQRSGHLPHYRFVAREIHEESGLLPAGWQSLLGTIREDGCRAFVLVTPAAAQPPSRQRSARGAPEETTEVRCGRYRQ